MTPATIGTMIQGIPAIIQAIGFLLDQFKHGPMAGTAAGHVATLTKSFDLETGKFLNVKTSDQSTLPGENALIAAGGETLGEQYTALTVRGSQDLQTQLLSFEQSVGAFFEVIGYRVPQLDQVMGKDNQVIGSLAGATGDIQHDRAALIAQVGSPDAGSPVVLNVQVQVTRLTTGKASRWLSFDQVLKGDL